MKPPIIMNRLGSATQVANSVLGANGTASAGITYGAAKHGNGFLSDANTENVSFVDTTIPVSEGIFQFFFKPTFNFGAQAGALFCDRAATNDYYQMIIFTTDIKVYIYGTGTNILLTDTTTTFSANDVLCCTVIYSNTAAYDGSKTASLYIDKSETASSTTSFGAWIRAGDMRLGIDCDASNNPANTESDCYIDTFKVWDNISDWQKIINNIDEERYGLNDHVIVI
jgi:hypothetical protein